MYSAIQTFGESLTAWMEDNGLTASDLAAYTRETRDATISRLMHDQLNYQRCARYITELSESYPNIDEETLKRLRASVDVNRYGKELYLAHRYFFEMITGKDVSSSPSHTKADLLSNKLLAWSEGKSFRLLCVGLTDNDPLAFLNLLCKKHKNIHIYHFFDQAYVGALSELLAETLSIAFNPNYELYEIIGSHGAMMNNAMVAQRDDGAHLLIVYDGGEFLTLRMSQESNLFDFILKLLLSKHHAPKKINRHFTHNSPSAFMDFLQNCLSLEKGRAIYQIKSEIGLEYVPIEILLNNFSEWISQGNSRSLPSVDDLKQLFESRYQNMLCKTEPTYLIMTKEGMLDFAKTGRMKDHPFCLRSFTPEERKKIINNLLEMAAKSVSFTPLILSSDNITLNHSIIGYSRECMLVCAAQSDYNLDDYTEIVLSSRTLSGQFADFVTNILLKNHVLNKKAGFEFIHSLMDVIPADE